ncbi:MAG: hypothetical protein ACK45V_10435 [Brevundimonas sp.]|uniref:hypothetical protein n=1 Tax=Brevundimonas sp. TaxID=1871086 RepID=UPI003918974F
MAKIVVHIGASALALDQCDIGQGEGDLSGDLGTVLGVAGSGPGKAKGNQQPKTKNAIEAVPNA